MKRAAGHRLLYLPLLSGVSIWTGFEKEGRAMPCENYVRLLKS